MSEVNSEHSSEKPRPVSTENLTQQPPAVAEKPSVSIRKIEANRLNALKARSEDYPRQELQPTKCNEAWIARPGNCCCRPDGFAGKNEFTQLLAQLREEHGPVGVLENWQIQKIAMALYMQSVGLRGQMGNFQRELRRCDFI